MTASNASVMTELIISHKHYHSKSAMLLQQGSRRLMMLHDSLGIFIALSKMCVIMCTMSDSQPSTECFIEPFHNFTAVFCKCLQKVTAITSPGWDTVDAMEMRELWVQFQIGNENVAPLGHSCVSNNISSFLWIRITQKYWFWMPGVMNKWFPPRFSRELTVEEEGWGGCWRIGGWLTVMCNALRGDSKNLELFEWVCRCMPLSTLRSSS